MNEMTITVNGAAIVVNFDEDDHVEIWLENGEIKYDVIDDEG